MSATQTCPKCGFEPPVSAAFCPKCGQSMKSASPVAASETTVRVSGSASSAAALKGTVVFGAEEMEAIERKLQAQGADISTYDDANERTELRLEAGEGEDKEPTFPPTTAEGEASTQADLVPPLAPAPLSPPSSVSGSAYEDDEYEEELHTLAVPPQRAKASAQISVEELEQEHTLSPNALEWQARDAVIEQAEESPLRRSTAASASFPPTKPAEDSPSSATLMVSGEHVAVEGALDRRTGSSSMFIPTKGLLDQLPDEAGEGASNQAQSSARKALNKTIMFGQHVPEEERDEGGTSLSEEPLTRGSTADLEALAGGKLQASFPTNEAPVSGSGAAKTMLMEPLPSSGEAEAMFHTMEPSALSASKAQGKASLLQPQAISKREIAEKMASLQSPIKGRSMQQTLAMDAEEMQAWMKDLGIADEPEVDEKIEDATEAIARAERAVDDGELETAIELYISLLRSFPEEKRYQQRLEQLWMMMRERPTAATSAPHSDDEEPEGNGGQRQRQMMLFGGIGGGLILLLFLGFGWPGFLRSGASTKPPKRPIPALRPALSTEATLQINSTPGGAEIWLNGAPTSYTTPKTFHKPAGRYQLELRLSGYHSLKKLLVLKPGQIFAVEFALAPKTPLAPVAVAVAPKARRGDRRRHTRLRRPTRPKWSLLTLQSTPAGARISLNDRDTGKKTPARFKLKTGRYQVQLQLEGYQTYIRDIGLYRRKKLLRVELLRSAAKQTRISIHSQPAGAAISLNGAATGKQTPAIIQVAAGTVKLTLSKDGYVKTTQTLTLKEGETRRISLRLSKRGPPGMVYIPSGYFWMGNNAGIARERPMRRVYMSGFWMDRYEVTTAEYAACVAAGVCRKAKRGPRCNGGRPDRAKHPINCVSWNDASRYCRWKKKRLPTEAQWEKAARGTSTQLYPWGHEAPACRFAVFGKLCAPGTQPVGSRPAGRSPYGLYDMSGNVWEWVRDYFDRNFYSKASNRNPYNPFRKSGYKVIRGGSWSTSREQLHVTYRLEYWPSRRSSTIGFRCAR